MEVRQVAAVVVSPQYTTGHERDYGGLPSFPPPPTQPRPRDLATGLDLVVVVVRLSYVTLTTLNYTLQVQDTCKECRYSNIKGGRGV